MSVDWDINKRLRRFVKTPETLRSIMGSYKTLIAGSLVIQFFERVTWDESDLDIYIEEGPGAEAMSQYLIQEEGYSEPETQDHEAYQDRLVSQVRGFLPSQHCYRC